MQDVRKNPYITLYVGQFGRLTANGSGYMAQILRRYMEHEVPLDNVGIRHLILAVSEEKGLKNASIRIAIRSFLNSGWKRNSTVWKKYTGWELDRPPDVNTAIKLICKSYADYEKNLRLSACAPGNNSSKC